MKFLKWLAELLHIHDWECVGRFRPDPYENPGKFRYQYCCRSCGEFVEIDNNLF